MIHPLFNNIVDRIFEQDPVLHKLVQKIKKDDKDATKEKDDDTNSRDRKIL